MRVPPVIGDRWQVWADDLRRYLARAQSQLSAREPAASANEDGVILWDRVNGYPVVSKGGVFRQVVLADGYAIFSQDTDITAAAPDTAYKIALDNIAAQGITLTGAPRPRSPSSRAACTPLHSPLRSPARLPAKWTFAFGLASTLWT